MSELIVSVAELDSRVTAAKSSEKDIEKLIDEFRSFLQGRVNKYSLKYDIYRRDELFGIAMYAFYEAIKNYDPLKGHFIPFANRVVCERLIDHIRSVYRNEANTISLEEADQAPNSSAMLDEVAIRQFENYRRQEMLLYEIEQLKTELAGWGITLESLVEKSPKHKKLKNLYKTVVKQIFQDPDIIQTIQIKRYFPVKAISELCKIPQKKIERARTYLIASIIIKMGDYELLLDYVDGGRTPE